MADLSARQSKLLLAEIYRRVENYYRTMEEDHARCRISKVEKDNGKQTEARRNASTNSPD